jgi:hypothetical protein
MRRCRVCNGTGMLLLGPCLKCLGTGRLFDEDDEIMSDDLEHYDDEEE